MRCAACGFENAVEATTCSRCESELGDACESCGLPIAPDARFCSNCGTPQSTAAAAADPPPARDVVAEPAPPPPPVERPSRPPASASADGITGVARAVRERAETRGGGDSSMTEHVLTFRIERHDDQGHPLPLVPVEVRGLSFSGSLTDGDWVEVRQRWQPGESLRVREFRNLTTGDTFRAKGSSKATTLIGLLIFLIVAGAMIGGFLYLVNQDL